MHDIYQKKGRNALRSLEKPYDRALKRIQSEYFPLSLYISKCFSEREVTIFIPQDLSNEGFDAKLFLDGTTVHVEITSTIDGKAKNEHFKNIEKNRESSLIREDGLAIEKEIERIKKIISKKADKNTYTTTPILLIEFDLNHLLNVLSERELKHLKTEIYYFIIKNKELLRKFSKIVLLKYLVAPSYVRNLYEDLRQKISLPTADELTIIIYELEVEKINLSEKQVKN